ncbi:MAG: alanine dehydrogenase, partial [Anaerolineales bacterium]
ARPTQQEMVWIRSGQTLLGFLHLNAAPKQEVKPLLEKKITALAYERMQDQEGRYPVLEPLSQIGGRMAATLAARLLQNDSGSRGVLLGGVPGVPPAEVVILGCGTAGANAARAFLGLGAQVTLLDKDLQRLRSLECGLPSRPVTMLSNPHTLQTAFSFADVVVGAVRVPGSRAPVIVTRELLAAMKPGALFIDLSIDEGGCAVTSRPTSHETPTFIEEGVMHCCIPNLPSAVARTSSHAFQIAAWPFVESIITKGVDTALQEDEGMAKGAMVQNGEAVSYRPVNYLEEVEE